MRQNHFAFFQDIAPETQAHLLTRLKQRHFPAGSIVIAAGEVRQEIYVIQSGAANVFTVDRHGDEYLIDHVRPGLLLGEVSFFSNQPASATVRATTDLDVRVIGSDDFDALTTTAPRLYYNLGVILSKRLARLTPRSGPTRLGQVVGLNDYGAPPVLGYALAASVAWHTHTSTLLLFLSVAEPPAEIQALVTTTSAGAHLRVETPTGSFEAERLAATLDDLRNRYDTILVQAPGDLLRPLGTLRVLDLVGAQRAVPARMRASHLSTPYTIQAWSDVGTHNRPDRAGVLHVPHLHPTDAAALAHGLLPPTTSASKAVGWAARDIATLKVGLALGAGGSKGYAHIGVLG